MQVEDQRETAVQAITTTQNLSQNLNLNPLSF